MSPNEREINNEVDRLINSEKSELATTFQKTHKELSRMNALMIFTISGLRDQGLNAQADLWSLALYINVAAFDISVALKNISFEREYWERRILARITAILLYEVTEDITRLLGKHIRKCLTELEVLELFNEDLKSVAKPVNRFWRTHQAELSNIRNSAYGHREIDGYKLLQAIDSIDPHKIMRFALEISQIINEIGPVLQRIITYTSTIRKPNHGDDNP